MSINERESVRPPAGSAPPPPRVPGHACDGGGGVCAHTEGTCLAHASRASHVPRTCFARASRAPPRASHTRASRTSHLARVSTGTRLTRHASRTLHACISGTGTRLVRASYTPQASRTPLGPRTHIARTLHTCHLTHINRHTACTRVAHHTPQTHFACASRALAHALHTPQASRTPCTSPASPGTWLAHVPHMSSTCHMPRARLRHTSHVYLEHRHTPCTRVAHTSHTPQASHGYRTRLAHASHLASAGTWLTSHTSRLTHASGFIHMSHTPRTHLTLQALHTPLAPCTHPSQALRTPHMPCTCLAHGSHLALALHALLTPLRSLPRAPRASPRASHMPFRPCTRHMHLRPCTRITHILHVP